LQAINKSSGDIKSVPRALLYMQYRSTKASTPPNLSNTENANFSTSSDSSE